MNLVTRKHLSRRAVLRGLGATVALPMLDAMTPAFAGASAGRPVRLAFAYVPNGVIMADWTPKGMGGEFALSRILKPLEPFREELLVLSGLVSILFGIVMFAKPGDGALVLLALIAAYAIVFGALELTVAIGGESLLKRSLRSVTATNKPQTSQ